jgi:O-acetyl-ADP-ribose deacetylase (regulator of RNase III)
MSMTVTLQHGDLLQQQVDAIVNTVNTVGVMGKGIALQFKQKWPENFKAYERACKRGEVLIGRMFIYDAGGLLKPRYIINFPTKQHWRERSRLSYIDEGLTDLIEQVKRLNIGSIAIPPLGCGNGGLEWDDVRPRIEQAFAQLPDVGVRVFAPEGAPAPRTQETRTAKPRLTPVRAALVKVLAAYRALEYSLTRLEVQKLAYFLEEAGEPLGLKFEANRYGPYSATLEHALKALDGHYLIGFGDRTALGEIQVAPGAVAEADECLAGSAQAETAARVDRVKDVIEGFESPYGMELLSTIHWVVTHPPHAHSLDEAVSAVHTWNPRKKQLMTPEHIRVGWNHLSSQHWIA